jgi:hypothetical protein
MRRLRRTDERGAITLFVVLMMPILVFFGALVLDGGAEAAPPPCR